MGLPSSRGCMSDVEVFLDKCFVHLEESLYELFPIPFLSAVINQS